MGYDDRAENKAQDLKGRAKEAAGAATDNRDLQAEGQADQAKASLKDKVDKATDKIKGALD
jgi:uncharacterized protein YjbJ (UPF0337 family)